MTGMSEPRESKFPAALAPQIRRAEAGDAAALAELSTALGYPSTTEQLDARLQSILGHPEHAVFVADTGGAEVVGYIQISVKRCVESDTVAEIVGLVVDERVRGGGLGRALVAEAERWAAACGLDAVVVRSRVHRTRAHLFYERLDYRHLKDQRVFRKTLR